MMISFKSKAHILMTAMMTLSASLFILFIAKEKFIQQARFTPHYYQHYLSEKITLILLEAKNKNMQCQKEKKETIKLKMKDDFYTFHCQKRSLFIQPAKEKYIAFNKIDDVLDLNRENIVIHSIRSLAELPASSEQDPQIVIVQNEIKERFDGTFYGIIITDFSFDFTGNGNIYGVIYSSFDNQREERKLAFKRKVIEQLEEKYSIWQYLPYSRSLFYYD